MRKPEDLTREQLMDVVEAIQGLLYLDMSGPDGECLTEQEKEAGIAPASDYWNPRKEWTPDCLDAIAAKLEEHGLVPAEPLNCPTEPSDCPPMVACRRCGSGVKSDGFCTDVACPFSDHSQDCEAGWSGHPEMDKKLLTCTCASQADHESTKVACRLCGQPADASTAHQHGGGWVGDECCWDERLKASE